MRVVFLSFFLFALQSAFSQSFTDVTNDQGIFLVPFHQELMGGGVAWVDYDNDGLTDLYFTGCRFGDALFRNTGDGFEDVSFSCGIEITQNYNSMGVIFGDINNDGFEDLFVTTWDAADSNELVRNLLFLNNGDGTFSEIGESAGILNASFATSAVFLDLNLDGFLDIYVLNYMSAANFILDEEGTTVGFEHECYDNVLYLNNGDLTFTESAEDYGVLSGACGLALAASDIDKDGDPDIQIANDFGEFITPNQLFLNNYPDPSFSDVSESTGFDIGLYGMGVAPGDFDNDLDQDYYITNLGKNAFLAQDNSELVFTDIALESGTDNTGNDSLFYTSWGDMFLDVNNDSHLDLYVANGHMSAAAFIQNEIFDPNRIFMNNGDLTFTENTFTSGLDYSGICRGSAFGDFNTDGKLDIAVVGIENSFNGALEGVKLYENNSDGGNWVSFTLEGTVANRNGFGSGVTLYTPEGAYYQELLGGSSHLSQNQSILHFGLGTSNSVDSVVVSWPGGQQQAETDLDINVTHHVIQELPTSIEENDEVVFQLNPVSASRNREFIFHSGANFALELEVLDLQGKVVFSTTVSNPTELLYFGMSSGMYIATLKNNQHTWATRFYISD